MKHGLSPFCWTGRICPGNVKLLTEQRVAVDKFSKTKPCIRSKAWSIYKTGSIRQKENNHGF
jgi:hypothetical protein